MSERYIFNFSFGLDPNLPGEVLNVFKALANSQSPKKSDLKALPDAAAGLLYDVDWLNECRPRLGAPVLIVETGIINKVNDRYHAPRPTHHVHFNYYMHDDAYANGGYAGPLSMFDLVGNHGLFCAMYAEYQRSSLTHYYKEFDDLLIVDMAAPSMAYPLPPNAKDEPEGYLQGWKPAEAADFKIENFLRLTSEMRKAEIADVESDEW